MSKTVSLRPSLRFFCVGIQQKSDDWFPDGKDNSLQVMAESWRIIDGAIVFFEGEEPTVAISAGNWQTVSVLSQIGEIK